MNANKKNPNRIRTKFMFRFSTSDNHAKVNANPDSARSRDSDTDFGYRAKSASPDVSEIYCLYSNREIVITRKFLNFSDCDSSPYFKNSDWYSWPIGLNGKKYLNCCQPRKTFRRTLEERAQRVLSLPPSWLRIGLTPVPSSAWWWVWIDSVSSSIISAICRGGILEVLRTLFSVKCHMCGWMSNG